MENSKIMTKIWYIVICILVISCNNNQNILDEEEIDEQESISRSINPWPDLCKVCQAFNTAYDRYKEIMDEGFKAYKEKKGCCKDCFELDFDEYYRFCDNLYIDQISAQIKNIECCGKMECPRCEPYADIQNSIVFALQLWPNDVQWAVNNAVSIAGKRKCGNWQETTEKDTTNGGGGHGTGIALPPIMETYRDVLTRDTRELLEEIGGDVETSWPMFRFDEYLLRICYAFYQSDDPIESSRMENISGQIDSEGRFYFPVFKLLYNYLREAYFEPELLTISELRAKGNDYQAIVIEKNVTTSSFDDDIFGDLWGKWGFESERTTSATEFYCWEF